MPTCYSAPHFAGRKFIFVHVPKTAGVSMTAALTGHVEPYENDLSLRSHIIDRSYEFLGQYQGILCWHITIDDLRTFYGDEEIDSYYSFAFIRNPWEWLVSMYAFIRGHQPHPESMICGHMTFKQFLRYFAAKNVSQHSFFAVNGRPAVTKVFRFEEMPQALQEIGSQTGLRFEQFPVENVSNHNAYWEYYDHEDVDLVRRAFSDDIALGGYAFETNLRIRYLGQRADLRRFILDGTPRSGTTALMGALSMHPHCFCANERFQIFADHDACLLPENLSNCEIPPAFPETDGIIQINVDAYLGQPLAESNAYPYLVDAEPQQCHTDRLISAFGNKTPRYYFNSLDICATGRVKWVAISRHPLEIASSWNARAGNNADTWSAEDIGLLGMMEYLQMCHALSQGTPEDVFVTVYDQAFFRNWRHSIDQLCAFLGLTADEKFLQNFEKYFVRSGKDPKIGRMAANEGEVLFCQVSGVDTLHDLFAKAGSGTLKKLAIKLPACMKTVYEKLDVIVRQYFESSEFYPNPEGVRAQILNNQSLFFARSRFQGLINPLEAPEDAPHLKAWLTFILFWRRAFAASCYYSEALITNSFSDPVKASFAAASTDMPYIFQEIRRRGLSATFAQGITTLNPNEIQEAASTLEEAKLLEDAQIIRYRAMLIAEGESARRAAAISFGAGEVHVQSRIGIGSGTWNSYLDMDGVRIGFP